MAGAGTQAALDRSVIPGSRRAAGCRHGEAGLVDELFADEFDCTPSATPRAMRDEFERSRLTQN